MEETDLRAQLEAKLRQQYLPAFESGRERREKRANQTEGEWLEEMARFIPRQHLTEEAKAELLAQRKEQLEAERQFTLDSLVQPKVEEVLPVLIEIRRETGADGPLTDAEVHQAQARASWFTVQRMGLKFRESAEKQTDPMKRELTAKLAEMALGKEQKYKDLGDPNVTNQQIEDFASSAAREFEELTAIIQKHRQERLENLTPDEAEPPPAE